MTNAVKCDDCGVIKNPEYDVMYLCRKDRSTTLCEVCYSNACSRLEREILLDIKNEDIHILRGLLWDRVRDLNLVEESTVTEYKKRLISQLKELDNRLLAQLEKRSS
jgi:hypothetical protein